MRTSQWRRVAATSGAAALFMTVLGPQPSFAQRVQPNLWGTNGTVSAVIRYGNTVYVGGNFTLVGPNTGCGVPIDAITGDPTRTFPRVLGVVRAVLPDGNGGWFIGGSFVSVGGVPRANLARIDASGAVTSWDPGADGDVLALARNGTALYVGGEFFHAAGASRRYAAAVDFTAGVATNWDPEPDAPVRALVEAPEGVYAGGDFASIGGQARNSLALLDPATGAAGAWDPDIGWFGSPGSVRAIATAGDTVYVGGDFGSAAGVERHLLAGIARGSGALAAWSPSASGPDDSYYGNAYVSTLVVHASTMYLGGHFTVVDGLTRGGLAAVDLGTGRATAWDPAPGPWTGTFNRDVTALALRESTVCVTGFFEEIGAKPRRAVAEVSLVTGLATAWDPNANDGALALAAAGRVVYVGGFFTGIGPQWQRRSLLAAFDAASGQVKEWNPNPDGLTVGALLAASGSIYVGGYFTSIGGQVRSGLAAVDTLTGAATDWDPAANNLVSTLALVGDTLLAGGYFTDMGGAPRDRLAAFDLVSGALTSWAPSANSDVYDVAVRGQTAYVAGFFSSMNGVARRYGLAAVDLVTGAVTNWNPQSDNWVNAVAVVGDTVFVGGRFSRVGGQPRANLAALDAATGLAMSWRADASSTVNALAVMKDTLFVGGTFSAVAGEPRNGLAAVALGSGAVLAWDPATDHGTVALKMAGSTLYVGGGMSRLSGEPAAGLAAVEFGPQSPPDLPQSPPRTVALAGIVPNPVSAMAIVRYALPSASVVNLALFDIQGRRVATLVNHEPQVAGWHEFPIRPDGLHGGVYFCRLEASGESAMQRMVVLR